jgi:hypothetical protein
MKKNSIFMKKLIFSIAMLATIISPINSRAQTTIDRGELPDVSIICKLSYYTVEIDLKIITFTYQVSVIECNNGFRQAVDNFWPN